VSRSLLPMTPRSPAQALHTDELLERGTTQLLIRHVLCRFWQTAAEAKGESPFKVCSAAAPPLMRPAATLVSRIIMHGVMCETGAVLGMLQRKHRAPVRLAQDPLAIIGIVSILFPFLILGIAIASGYLDLSPYSYPHH